MAYSSNFTKVPSTMESINQSIKKLGYKFQIGGHLRINNHHYKIIEKEKHRHAEPILDYAAPSVRPCQGSRGSQHLYFCGPT